MKMTRLEFFESGLGLMAVRMGIVSLEWLVKYDVYRCYLDFKAAGSSDGEAKLLTADKCKCHISTVYRYIERFEKDAEQEIIPQKSGNRYGSGNGYWKKWPSQANPCKDTV